MERDLSRANEGKREKSSYLRKPRVLVSQVPSLPVRLKFSLVRNSILFSENSEIIRLALSLCQVDFYFMFLLFFITQFFGCSDDG